MVDRRTLNFATEADAIAEIERLRSGYVKTANWSLNQIAFHTGFPISFPMQSPATMSATPEQKQMQSFLENVVANGWPPSRLDSPPPMRPPDEPNPSVVDELVSNLKKLAAYQEKYIDAGVFGPLETSKYRRFHLIHIAHHLGFLQPKTDRRTLRYADEIELAADLNRLRHGYTRAGTWSLPQICWHLAKATEYSMRPGPFPEMTPEQIAARPKLDRILSGENLPSGLTAPEFLAPPADCTEGEIDRLMTAMYAAKAFPGPFAPHRLFGTLTTDEARKLRLAHCAHHLSHLIPTHSES